MPNDRDFFDGSQTDREASPGNLPMAPVSDADDDDGIFINWPGFSYDGDSDPSYDDREPDDGDLSDEDDSAAFDDKPKKREKPKKKKEKKSKKKSADSDADSTEDAETDDGYAFRRAADSDMEESRG